LPNADHHFAILAADPFIVDMLIEDDKRALVRCWRVLKKLLQRD
jgi:hypothetical protein